MHLGFIHGLKSLKQHHRKVRPRGFLLDGHTFKISSMESRVWNNNIVRFCSFNLNCYTFRISFTESNVWNSTIGKNTFAAFIWLRIYSRTQKLETLPQSRKVGLCSFYLKGRTFRISSTVSNVSNRITGKYAFVAFISMVTHLGYYWLFKESKVCNRIDHRIVGLSSFQFNGQTFRILSTDSNVCSRTIGKYAFVAFILMVTS